MAAHACAQLRALQVHSALSCGLEQVPAGAWGSSQHSEVCLVSGKRPWLGRRIDSELRAAVPVVARVPGPAFPCPAAGDGRRAVGSQPCAGFAAWLFGRMQTPSFPHCPRGFSRHNLNINSILTTVRDERWMRCVSLEQAAWAEVKHSSSL